MVLIVRREDPLRGDADRIDATLFAALDFLYRGAVEAMRAVSNDGRPAAIVGVEFVVRRHSKNQIELRVFDAKGKPVC